MRPDKAKWGGWGWDKLALVVVDWGSEQVTTRCLLDTLMDGGDFHRLG